MKNSKRAVIALIACSLLAGTGCSSIEVGKETDSNLSVTTSDQYPIETDVELTYWVPLNASIAAYASSMNEIPYKSYIEEATGIKVRYEHPPVGQEGTAFNLMIASMELPDIIDYNNWFSYRGGGQKAIADNVILPLNEYIEKVSPNLNKVLQENPDIKKQISTEEGEVYCYPFLTLDDRLRSYEGFVVREDLLEKYNLEVPQTLEEWNEVLYTFKENGVEKPLSILWSAYRDVSPFTGFFGFFADFYVEDDTIKYGPYQEKYRDYVALLNQWYNDGILDRDLSAVDNTALTSYAINGKIGATYCMAGSQLGTWSTAINDAGSSISYLPVPYMTEKKGETPKFGQKARQFRGNGATITTQCKNPEIAARFLDYGYSEEGQLLNNFGKEGVSYNMIDGYPTYTDIITDSVKNGGLSMAQALSKYLRGGYSGPFVQDSRYHEQYLNSPLLDSAIKTWQNTDMDKYLVPVLNMTIEEQEEYDNIIKDVQTYEMEMLYKYISGKEDCSNMDEYFNVMKNMGIERAIELKQIAYDRYMKQ